MIKSYFFRTLFMTFIIGVCSFKGHAQKQSNYLASSSLIKIEGSTNLETINGYVGFGILSAFETRLLHFTSATLGPRVQKLDGVTYVAPQLSLTYLLGPRFNGGAKIWSPITPNNHDIIITPEIGVSFLFGFAYATAGYDFNLTNNLNFRNNFNVSIGLYIPPGIENIVMKI